VLRSDGHIVKDAKPAASAGRGVVPGRPHQSKAAAPVLGLHNGVDEGDVSGGSVSGAGDVNGDGFDDLIIGAPNADEGGPDLLAAVLAAQDYFEGRARYVLMCVCVFSRWCWLIRC
jgi:hypothetical protein